MLQKQACTQEVVQNERKTPQQDEQCPVDSSRVDDSCALTLVETRVKTSAKVGRGFRDTLVENDALAARGDELVDVLLQGFSALDDATHRHGGQERA